MLKSKYLGLTIAAVLLLAEASIAQDQPQFAERQPQSIYTIYNGKVFMHPEEPEGWFSRLFSFSAKNPVVSTVLGWSDSMSSWYHGAPSNETETMPPDNVASSGSVSHAQYAPAPSYGYDTRYPPNPKFPQNQQFGKQPYQGAQPQYPSNNNNFINNQQYPQQPNQPRYQPRPQQQSQQPSVNSYRPVTRPEMPPPYLNPSNFQYPNPQVEIVTLESQGSMDNYLGSQDRNFQVGSTLQQQQGDAESESQQQQVHEHIPEAPGKAEETSKGDDEMLEEDNPCPRSGQWKWDGDICITDGPPTWACRPDDLVTTGRATFCRNKIFFNA